MVRKDQHNRRKSTRVGWLTFVSPDQANDGALYQLPTDSGGNLIGSSLPSPNIPTVEPDPSLEIDFSSLSCIQINSLIQYVDSKLASSSSAQYGYYQNKRVQLVTVKNTKKCFLTPLDGIFDGPTSDAYLEVDINTLTCSQISASIDYINNKLLSQLTAEAMAYYKGKLAALQAAYESKCDKKTTDPIVVGNGTPVGSGSSGDGVVNVFASTPVFTSSAVPTLMPGGGGMGGAGGAGGGGGSSATTTKKSIWPIILTVALCGFVVYETNKATW